MYKRSIRNMKSNHNYTREELIKKYIEFSNTLRKKDGASSVDIERFASKHNMPSYFTYKKIFKKMETLKIEAGYNIVKKEYSDNEVLEKINDFYKKNKRYPARADCSGKNDFISYYEVLKRYGSLKNMYAKFGIKEFSTRVIGLKKEDDLVLQDVADIIIKYDAHTWTKFRELKISPAGKAYKRRLNMNWFEMYNKAMDANKTRFLTKEDVIKKYEDVKQKLNKDIVGVNDLKKFNISTKSFTKFWGSYANFIEEYEQVDVQVKHFYYTEEELIKMYIDFSNYLNKEEGASDADFEKYAAEYGIPSHGHYRKKFTTASNLKIKAGYEPIRSNYPQFTREQIIELMYKAYKKHKRKLNRVEIKKEKALPSYVTIGRYLNETSVKKIWEIVLSEKEK